MIREIRAKNLAIDSISCRKVFKFIITIQHIHKHRTRSFNECRISFGINKNLLVPARRRGEGEYLLTTKLFCGHCREMMTGYGGTSHSGEYYPYYACKKARRGKCDKRIIGKQKIEDRVIRACLDLLTDDNIVFIAKCVAAEFGKDPDSLRVRIRSKALRTQKFCRFERGGNYHLERLKTGL